MPERPAASVPDSERHPAPGSPSTPHTHRTGLLLTLVLGGLTATAPLATDMYLPSLPEVTRSLHAPAATVQLTLTACLAGRAPLWCCRRTPCVRGGGGPAAGRGRPWRLGWPARFGGAERIAV